MCCCSPLLRMLCSRKNEEPVEHPAVPVPNLALNKLSRPISLEESSVDLKKLLKHLHYYNELQILYHKESSSSAQSLPEECADPLPRLVLKRKGTWEPFQPNKIDFGLSQAPLIQRLPHATVQEIVACVSRSLASLKEDPVSSERIRHYVIQEMHRREIRIQPPLFHFLLNKTGGISVKVGLRILNCKGVEELSEEDSETFLTVHRQHLLESASLSMSSTSSARESFLSSSGVRDQTARRRSTQFS